MDDFMDPFLSSASWPDMNISSRSSWTDSIASQSNGLLTDSVKPYGGDEKTAPICMMPSAHIRNVATENLDLHDGNLKYLAQHELPGHLSHSSQHDTETHESNFALNEVYESNSASGSYCRETLPHSALTLSSSIESNGSEPSKFAQSLGDAHSISSVPSMWPPSYSCVSTFIEQGKLQDFGFQGVESVADVLGTTYVENGKYPCLNNSAVLSVHDCNGLPSTNLPNFNFGQQMKITNGGLHPPPQEQNGLHNLHLPSFSGMQAHHQLSQSTERNNLKHQTDHASGVLQHLTPANNNVCNGAAKPRVRARRGQATDPHSIAERLRREKIAERMKNLQELVPNSNKADKASMLDEIIGYVKFLQLQVKVLSMSRLGAAGAVLPLITDVQVEGHRAADLSEVKDDFALEQEVLKLMESNVTSAMHYLQNKGVCLMPIALASAISSLKGSTAAVPSYRTQPYVNHGVIKQEDALKPV